MKFFLILVVLPFLISTQGEFKITQEKGDIQVLGTSSVHDWESEVEVFTVTGSIVDQSITNLKVVIPVTSIESGKDIMNDKTFEALKFKKHPQLTFEASQLDMSDQSVMGQGKLTIAGVTKSIPIKGQITSQSATQADVKGSVTLNMSEYGITPPTAMFGSLKTGDEVTIQFNISIPK